MSWRTPEAIAAVCRHMNDDHADDMVTICHTHGHPEVVAAHMTDLLADAIVLRVEPSGALVEIPLDPPPTTRPEVREAIAKLVTPNARQ